MADPISLLDIHLERPGYNLVIEAGPVIPALIVLALIGLLARWLLRRQGVGRQLELDGVELGLDGAASFSFKPNWNDRQIAYAIWVELSTRKIGLPIDLENDVISEVYDSWYAFFGVTRELIKTMPVSKAADESTQEIIRLSVAVLNDALRPHLTCWQARFRRWYAAEEAKPANKDRDPQTIQSAYPRWNEMVADLQRRNEGMIYYRDALEAIVKGTPMPKGHARAAA